MIEESKAFCVYKITNKINGKIYIGKTGDVEDRWSKHLSAVKSASKKKLLIHQAMAEDGVNNFTFQIIEYCNNEAKALNQERFWIDYHKTNVCKYGSEFGYNQTAGGQGISGYKHSEESRQKMSEAQLGEKNHFFGKTHAEETCQKISNAQLGENNHNFGKIHSEETRQKISKTNIGKTHTEETCQKISKAHTGKIVSEETCQKISVARIGKTHTKETRQKMSETRGGEKNYWAKLSEEQINVIYSDPRKIIQIAAEYNVSLSTIYNVKAGRTYKDITKKIKNNQQ